MNNDIKFFLAECISRARTLPLRESVSFLNGLLLIAGDSPETAEIRKTFVLLKECDSQLDLIAPEEKQVSMPFNGNGGKKI